MNPIPYGKQNITAEDIEAVVKVLKADFLTQGPKIAEFEENFAQYIGANYAVAVSNGTAALHLAAMALGIEPGDRVITTPITFAASANCVLYCDGEVHFADIDPETYTISLDSIEKLLKSKAKGYFKGVIPVDFTGYPVNLESLKKICCDYGMWILEDACHAPGGYFIDSNGEKQYCGNSNYAEAAIFSFHPVKHIASGEGGMITTNKKEVYEKLLVLRTHGITREKLIKDFPNPELQGGWFYEMQELGYNYRITDFQAALGNSQLKRADEGLKRRQEIAEKYYTAFSGNKKIKLQKRSDDNFNAHHLFVIEVDDRKGLYDHLKTNNIYAQIHYIPVHLMPFYKKFGWKEGDFPNAEKYYEKCISLPMYPTLTEEEQNYVIENVINFV